MASVKAFMPNINGSTKIMRGFMFTMKPLMKTISPLMTAIKCWASNTHPLTAIIKSVQTTAAGLVATFTGRRTAIA